MDSARLKTSFDRDGYAVVRKFLSDAQRSELAENLDRYIRTVVPTLPDDAAFYQDRSRPETLKQLHQMDCDPFFEAYRRRPQWQDLAEALIGEPVEGRPPEWFNKPPGTEHATPPHQDNFYFCLRPPNVLTLWLALERVDEENGCLRYVAGSHRLGLRPHESSQTLGFSQTVRDFGDEDRRRERAVSLEAGDLVAHHGEIIHRADANRSPDRHRPAFAIVYQGVSCRRDPEAYEHYLAALSRQHDGMGLQK